VIDLGTPGPHATDDFGPRRCDWPTGPRAWAALAVAVLAGVLAGAPADAVPRPRIEILSPLPPSSTVLPADRYLLATAGNEISAYAPAGHRLWEIQVPAAEYAQPDGDRILVVRAVGLTADSYVDPDALNRAYEANKGLVVLEAATGRRIWEQRGGVLTSSSAMMTLVADRPDGRRVLKGVATATGAVVWEREIALDTRWSAALDRNELVLTEASGEVHQIRGDTGELVLTGRIPPGSHVLYAHGNLLMVAEPDRVVAYRFGTSEILWSRGGGEEEIPWPCEGGRLCVQSVSGLVEVDRATGRDLSVLVLSGPVEGAVDVEPRGWITVGRIDEARRLLLRAASNGAPAWLGVGTPTGTVRPITPIEATVVVTHCETVDRWIACWDQDSGHRLAILRADLDAYLAGLHLNSSTTN
jgi:hypothetical protein